MMVMPMITVTEDDENGDDDDHCVDCEVGDQEVQRKEQYDKDLSYHC